jgi:hypothetical protein
LGSAQSVLFLVPPDNYDIQNPVAFNIGAYLDPQSTPKAIYSLASSMDLFTFWRIAEQPISAIEKDYN